MLTKAGEHRTARCDGSEFSGSGTQKSVVVTFFLVRTAVGGRRQFELGETTARPIFCVPLAMSVASLPAIGTLRSAVRFLFFCFLASVPKFIVFLCWGGVSQVQLFCFFWGGEEPKSEERA